MASDEDHAPAATVTLRRRPRLVRGPLTIGEPSPPVEVRLGAEEPYRPDTIADGGHACGLTVRAASVRGLSKRFAGGPRQDDLCLRVHEPTNTLIAAVADGVSSAARSGLAAALAVRYATAAVARQLDADAGADAGAGELAWGEIFRQAAWALVEEHRREVRDHDAGVEDAAATLATTLLVAAVAGPGEDGEASRVQLAAVGDSPAYMLANRAFERVVGEPQDRDGLIGGGVEALPRAQEPQSHACTLAPGSALLLCTDGVSLPLADGGGEVGRTLARELANPPGIVDFAGLLDFSRATYDDDRTLVAIWAKR